MPRITRGGVALGAALLMFATFLVFGGRLLGDESGSGAPPSVPSADSSAAPSVPTAAQPDTSAIGSSGGALPQAQGVQAASSQDVETAPPPPRRDESLGWPQIVLYTALGTVSMLLFIVAATTLWWMLHAWRSPEALASNGFR